MSPLSQKEKDSRRSTTFTRIGRDLLTWIKQIASSKGITARYQMERCITGQDKEASKILRECFKEAK